MIIYLTAYIVSFITARLGWFLPSGLVLMAGTLYLYWEDYRASGNFIHLRGLFCLFFGGGQAVSCFKLSHLQGQWSVMAWVCFLAAMIAFYYGFAAAEKRKLEKDRKNGRKTQEQKAAIFRAIFAVTLVSLGAFSLEAVVLGYIPLFIRNMPHAYSYFHLSGVHYFTVSCVLVPSFSVLYFFIQWEEGAEETVLHFHAPICSPTAIHKRWADKRDRMVVGLTAVSLLIPLLCVSRSQLILAVGMAVFTFLSIKHRLPVRWGIGMGVSVLLAYLVLTAARSHSIEYLNGIFEMKNAAMPIFITQPYIYIANNYDNFNCLVEQLPAHSWGMKMLFPFWALTGLKFLVPEVVNYPLYLNKAELTTLTLIYDAYYDFGLVGVVVFCGILGGICALLVKNISQMDNPVGYVVYAQMAMYMVLSFFTTWFSNPTTWFYFTVTGMVYLYIGCRAKNCCWKRKRRIQDAGQ